MIRRTVALAAVLVAAVVVAVVLLGGGEGYELKLRTQSASQLVKGNLVQVAGQEVGKVKEIRLTDDGMAEVRVAIHDDYAPLRRGTRAVIRQASLSGIANRYIDLQQGAMTGKTIPNGAVLPASDTESVVDIDQLFNIFDPETRRNTRRVIAGFAEMTSGREQEANRALRYLNPVLSASERLFGELGRNDDLLERFVVESSRLVTDVADKREDLAGLVQNFGAVSTALASRDTELREAVNRLPTFLRKANTTFVNLRATLEDLDPLVEASRPVVRDLRPLLRDLRPLARDSAPTFRSLAGAIRKPGSDNDLVELMQAQPALARAATQPVEANGERRRAAFPELAEALRESTPQLAYFRPYAPDLIGWFDDFSTSGSFDAIGNFSRAGLAFSAFTFTPGLNLVPVPPELRDDVLAAGAELGRNNRCPGSVERNVDGSNPYRDTADFNCDPSQVPVGE